MQGQRLGSGAGCSRRSPKSGQSETEDFCPARRLLTAGLYADHGAHGRNTFAHRFGSWNKALEAAGLKVMLRQNVPVAELLENIGDVWRKLGRQPGSRELTKRGGFSKFAGDTYRWRFGSWHNARTNNWRLRATVLIRDNCLCRMCDASPPKDPAVTLHVDHIVPWSKGGQTVLANLQTLCAICNIGKGDLSPERPVART